MLNIMWEKENMFYNALKPFILWVDNFGLHGNGINYVQVCMKKKVK